MIKFFFDNEKYEIEIKFSRAGMRVMQAVGNASVSINDDDFNPEHLIESINGEIFSEFSPAIQYRALNEVWVHVNGVYFPEKKGKPGAASEPT